MNTDTIHFSGADFTLTPDELTPGLLLAMRACGGPGDAGPAVQHVRDKYLVTGDPATCREYLTGYGAWGDAELSDHDTNLDRLVWLAGGDLLGCGEAYFSAGGAS